MSKPAQIEVIHVGQPWSTSQEQFRVSHKFGRVEDGLALLHTLSTTGSAMACSLISQPEEGLFLAGLVETLILVQNTAPGVALTTREVCIDV